MTLTILFICFTVGYKMEELVIGFIDKPLDVAPEVKFSLERYSMVDRKFEDCSRNYTGGQLQIRPETVWHY